MPFGVRTEPVADGVWLVRGGLPVRNMNVYLLEDEGGLTVFDAGIEAMAEGIAEEAAKLGGIKRVLLSHSHADHRGAAAGLGRPVLCHPAEVADAEGDGGMHYLDFSKIRLPPARWLYPSLLRHWDGGPVKVAGTVSEGDEVADFTVLHFPGHAPGLIGLWRERDRLALVSDVLYTLNPETGRFLKEPHLPHPTFTPNREQARASLRKLAALEPRSVWPGHANPVIGDVRTRLEEAAETT